MNLSPPKAPRLTVGIPTFNGADSLGSVLESVLSQSKVGQIEILISDNCSTDGTRSLVERTQEKTPIPISYYRNDHNVGFDANVDLVVRRAKGDFVWILSDDDLLLPGAIEHVLKVIEADDDIVYLLANYDYFRGLGVEEDHYCADGNEFYLLSNFKNCLISSNIVSKKCWMSLDMQQYIGCLWIHLAYTMEALSPLKGNRSVIIAENVLKKVGGMKWGLDGSFIFTGFKFIDLHGKLGSLGYGKKVEKKAVKTIEGVYHYNIPIAIEMGLKVDRDLIDQFVSRYDDVPTFWCIDLPLLLIPRPVHILFQIVRKKIRGRPPKE